ncbi:MAG: hypothetical protein ACRD2F_08710, partial [Terriglobales bacterium]
MAKVAACLEPHRAELGARWRRRVTGLPRGAAPAVGRLLVEGGLPLLAVHNVAAYAESVDY